MTQYDFRTIKYIPGLNAMRALSVIIVMLAHFGFGNIVPGGFGVTTFFFVSGFLITTLLHEEFCGTAGCRSRSSMSDAFCG